MNMQLYLQQLDPNTDSEYDNTIHKVLKRSMFILEAFNYFVLLVVTMVILFFMYTCCMIGKAKKIYNQHFQEHCHIQDVNYPKEMERPPHSELPNSQNDAAADEALHHHKDCHHQYCQPGHHHFDCDNHVFDGHGFGADGGGDDMGDGAHCGAEMMILTII